MRIPAFPIVASFVLLAAPAFAQTSGITSTQPSGAATSTNMSSNPSQHGSGVTSDTQQKIRQSLESSGFKNVRVTPEAFVIHAQAPDGSRVVMMLRPDELVGVVEQSGASSHPYGSTQSGAGGSSQPSGSMPNTPSSSGQGGMTR